MQGSFVRRSPLHLLRPPAQKMKTENGVKSTIQTDPCDYKGHTHTQIITEKEKEREREIYIYILTVYILCSSRGQRLSTAKSKSPLPPICGLLLELRCIAPHARIEALTHILLGAPPFARRSRDGEGVEAAEAGQPDLARTGRLDDMDDVDGMLF